MVEADDRSSNQLHLTFVEMLFALAIGEVAVDAANLVSIEVESSLSFRSSLPVFSHLLLATVVIAASWVGWRNSQFSGSNIKSVFSLDFVELLTDVFLVICYFLLVRLAEVPTGSPLVVTPNASHETWMIVLIMATYMFWDLLSCRTDRGKFGKRVWASVVCLVITVIGACVLPLHSHSATAVVLVDVALLAIVFLFRAMKLHDWDEHTLRSKSGIVALFLVLGASSAFAHVAARFA
jgi:hypothetical protein